MDFKILKYGAKWETEVIKFYLGKNEFWKNCKILIS